MLPALLVAERGRRPNGPSRRKTKCSVITGNSGGYGHVSLHTIALNRARSVLRPSEIFATARMVDLRSTINVATVDHA